MEIFIIITISFIMFIRNTTFKSSRQLIPFTEADTATNAVSSFGAYFALQSFASHIYIVTWLTCVSCKNQINRSAQFTNNNINRAFLCVCQNTCSYVFINSGVLTANCWSITSYVVDWYHNLPVHTYSLS